MTLEFPLYRQLGDLPIFIEILDERHFVEYRKIGQKWLISQIHASQFPEIIRINDMISLENPFVDVSREEFLMNIHGANSAPII